MFAELLAKQLMLRGQSDITDHELHKLVFAIAEKTDLDDGTLAPPPPFPLPPSFALDEFPLSLCDVMGSNVGRQLPATKGPTGASELKPFFFLETQKNHS